MLKINKLISLSAVALIFTMNSAFALVGDGRSKANVEDSILTAQLLVLSDTSFVIRVKNQSLKKYNVVALPSYDNAGTLLPPFVNVDNKCNSKNLAGLRTCDITYTAKPYYEPNKSFPFADENVNVSIQLATNTEPKNVSPAYKFKMNYSYKLYAHTTAGTAYIFNGTKWDVTTPITTQSNAIDECSRGGNISGGVSGDTQITCQTSNGSSRYDYFNGSQYCTIRGNDKPTVYAADLNPLGLVVIGGCFWSKGTRDLSAKPYPLFNLAWSSTPFGASSDSPWNSIVLDQDGHTQGVNANVRTLTHSVDGKYEVFGGDFTDVCTGNSYYGCTEKGRSLSHIGYFKIKDNKSPDGNWSNLGAGLDSPVDDVQFISSFIVVKPEITAAVQDRRNGGYDYFFFNNGRYKSCDLSNNTCSGPYLTTGLGLSSSEATKIIAAYAGDGYPEDYNVYMTDGKVASCNFELNMCYPSHSIIAMDGLTILELPKLLGSINYPIHTHNYFLASGMVKTCTPQAPFLCSLNLTTSYGLSSSEAKEIIASLHDYKSGANFFLLNDGMYRRCDSVNNSCSEPKPISDLGL